MILFALKASSRSRSEPRLSSQIIITYNVSDNCGNAYIDLVCTQDVNPAIIPSLPICPVLDTVTCDVAQTLTISDYTPIISTNGFSGVCNITITATPIDVNLLNVNCSGTGDVLITYQLTDNCSGTYSNIICSQPVFPALIPIYKQMTYIYI